MTPKQPEWESGEDRHWMEGIPEDWPTSGPEADTTPSNAHPPTLTQRQWENKVAQVLDEYNDGKISREIMGLILKDLKKAKIR